MERIVVIDTDPGLDDALALFLALKAHKVSTIPFQIVAITCVHGNTSLKNVGRNITTIIETVGLEKKIPIHLGAADPIVRKLPERSKFHGEDGFGDCGVKPKSEPIFQREHAAIELVNLARNFAGKLTIIALGPLTNIALAIKLDPEFKKNVYELCVMGGNIYGMGNNNKGISAEYNFLADPEAAHVVFDAPFVKPILLAPLETCRNEAKLDYDWRKNVMGRVQSPMVELMNCIEAQRLARPISQTFGWTSCDALLLSCILNQKIVKERRLFYSCVELDGTNTRGQMVVDHSSATGKAANVFAITKIDLDQFKATMLWGLSTNTENQGNIIDLLQ